MATVRVWVPATVRVPYLIEVDELTPEKITQALRNTDPADWETDPNFYEVLGSNWQDFVERATLSDVEVVKGPVQLSCPECKGTFYIDPSREGVITCPYCSTLVEDWGRW
jgi:uncharacterized Zn-finger protein